MFVRNTFLDFGAAASEDSSRRRSQTAPPPSPPGGSGGNIQHSGCGRGPGLVRISLGNAGSPADVDGRGMGSEPRCSSPCNTPGVDNIGFMRHAGLPMPAAFEVAADSGCMSFDSGVGGVDPMDHIHSSVFMVQPGGPAPHDVPVASGCSSAGVYMGGEAGGHYGAGRRSTVAGPPYARQAGGMGGEGASSVSGGTQGRASTHWSGLTRNVGGMAGAEQLVGPNIPAMVRGLAPSRREERGKFLQQRRDRALAMQHQPAASSSSSTSAPAPYSDQSAVAAAASVECAAVTDQDVTGQMWTCPVQHHFMPMMMPALTDCWLPPHHMQAAAAAAAVAQGQHAADAQGMSKYATDEGDGGAIMAMQGSMPELPCALQPHSLTCLMSQGNLGDNLKVHWRVDARKLRGSDKMAVSPSFSFMPLRGLEQMPVTFKMMIYPKYVCDNKGSASFKKSQGRGRVRLKCESDVVPGATEFQFSIAVGHDHSATHGAPLQPARGPVAHNFAHTAVGGLPRSEEEWDFGAATDPTSMTFLVSLAIALAGG